MFYSFFNYFIEFSTIPISSTVNPYNPYTNLSISPSFSAVDTEGVAFLTFLVAHRFDAVEQQFKVRLKKLYISTADSLLQKGFINGFLRCDGCKIHTQMLKLYVVRTERYVRK
jgi:hypothetical protein